MGPAEETRLGSVTAWLRRNTSGVRSRLFAYAALILLLGIAGTVFTMREILISQLDDRVQDELSQEVREFQNLETGIDPATGKPFGDNLKRLFTLYFQRNVLAPDERLLTFIDAQPYLGKTPSRWIDSSGLQDMSPELTAIWKSPTTIRSGTAQIPSGEARYMAVPVRSGNEVRGSFVVGYLVEPDREKVDAAVRTAALVGLFALLVGSLVAYLGAGRVLHPLRELTDAARSIEDSDLTRRINVTGHDEISELGVTFNAMLDRLETSFGSQRDLIRNVNHELRTPITIVRGHIELLEDDPEDRRATIELVTRELDRMSLLVDDLLTLARSEGSDFLEKEPVAIYPFLDELLDKAGSLGERVWKLNVAGDPGEAEVDPRRLTQAMLNLIDNAVRQTDPGKVIEIGASREGAILRLWVEDQGSGIAPSDRQRLFRRFERGSGRRYPGTGLGLPIVRVITEAHGGVVSVGDSDLGGARFTISLPVDPTPRPRESERGDE
ncbi:MAG TPA: HAMP domain-containing sensor histidine kinase [Solirubrobacterales bacterium]|nr:HAMP domain-containing sensor histidine kinase [Solirubrobacterales bacterium]